MFGNHKMKGSKIYLTISSFYVRHWAALTAPQSAPTVHYTSRISSSLPIECTISFHISLRLSKVFPSESVLHILLFTCRLGRLHFEHPLPRCSSYAMYCYYGLWSESGRCIYNFLKFFFLFYENEKRKV